MGLSRYISCGPPFFFVHPLEIAAWDVGCPAAGGSIRTKIGSVRAYDMVNSFLICL